MIAMQCYYDYHYITTITMIAIFILLPMITVHLMITMIIMLQLFLWLSRNYDFHDYYVPTVRFVLVTTFQLLMICFKGEITWRSLKYAEALLMIVPIFDTRMQFFGTNILNQIFGDLFVQYFLKHKIHSHTFLSNADEFQSLCTEDKSKPTYQKL